MLWPSGCARRRIARGSAATSSVGSRGGKNFSQAAGWEGVMVAACPDPAVEGRTLAEIAAGEDLDPADVILDLLLDHEGRVTVVLHFMDEADVRRVMAHPLAMIASDGIPLPGKPHPRWCGTFARVLGRYTRDEGLLDLATAIAKMTSMPAERFGLRGRGRIAEGAKADVVVFDPDVYRRSRDVRRPARGTGGHAPGDRQRPGGRLRRHAHRPPARHVRGVELSGGPVPWVDGALSISGDAIFDNLEAFAAFSAPGAGVTRTAWSGPELQAANAWLSERMAGLGLAVDVDAAGNVSGAGRSARARRCSSGRTWTASRTAVASTGRWASSARSRVAAIEAPASGRSARSGWCRGWTRRAPGFGTSLFGSRAFAGRDVSGDGDRVDAGGVTLADAMRGWGLDPARVARARGIDGIGEPGARASSRARACRARGIDVGVVSGLVGLLACDVVFHGQANHAGTTPMDARRDALAAAARTVLVIREEARRRPGPSPTSGTWPSGPARPTSSPVARS